MKTIPVGRIGNTSEGVVPGKECGDDTEPSTGLDSGAVWCSTGGSTSVVEVTNAQAKECEVESEEKHEECDGRFECAE